jgi:transformation/transcription domain-associated protein
MSNLPDQTSMQTPNQNQTTIQNQIQHQHQQQPANQANNLNILTHSGLVTIEFTHQTFQAWIDALVDPNTSEDLKLKAIQDLSFNLELMQTLSTYPQLIEDAMHKFMRLLSETEPQFIAESTVQQLRKKTLEIIQRTTPIVNNSNSQNVMNNLDPRTALIRDVLLLIYRLIERENEENVIICLKILTDYHRHLRTTSLLINEVIFQFLFFLYFYYF